MQCGIPEQSKSLMESLSSGTAFFEDSFLFVSSENVQTKNNALSASAKFITSEWLMCIGYPCEGEFSVSRFINALDIVKEKLTPESIFVIAPQFPDFLEKHIIDRDVFYNLDLSKPLSSTLSRVIKKNNECIKQGILFLDITKDFTKAHQDLWIEFVGRSPMPPRVRSLYANIATKLIVDGIRSGKTNH